MKKSFILSSIIAIAALLPTPSVEAATNTTGCRAYFGNRCVQYYNEHSANYGALPSNRDPNCHAYYVNKCVQYRSSVSRSQPMTVCKQYFPYYSGCYRIRKS